MEPPAAPGPEELVVSYLGSNITFAKRFEAVEAARQVGLARGVATTCAQFGWVLPGEMTEAAVLAATAAVCDADGDRHTVDLITISRTGGGDWEVLIKARWYVVVEPAS